jgi:hypothetical protein
VFDEWNKTELDSFLIEITADILKYKENGEHLLPKIKDNAGQVRMTFRVCFCANKYFYMTFHSFILCRRAPESGPQ